MLPRAALLLIFISLLAAGTFAAQTNLVSLGIAIDNSQSNYVIDASPSAQTISFTITATRVDSQVSSIDVDLKRIDPNGNSSTIQSWTAQSFSGNTITLTSPSSGTTQIVSPAFQRGVYTYFAIVKGITQSGTPKTEMYLVDNSASVGFFVVTKRAVVPETNPILALGAALAALGAIGISKKRHI